MTIMKFLLLNAQSFNTAKYDVLDIVNKCDIDFLCLNGTWEEKKKPISFQNWRTLSKPRHNGIHGGVAIFINQKKSTYIIEATNDFNDENLECVSIKIIKTNLNVEINLVVAYEPPNKDDQLKTLVSKVQKLGKKNILLLGDLNAKSKECHNSVANTAGSVVEDLMTTCNLVCYNDGQPTRRDSNSIVDLVLCSAELSKYSQSCTTLIHEKIRFDHIAVLYEANFDLTDAAPEVKLIRQMKKADWNKWGEVTHTTFENFTSKVEGNLEKDYVKFCELLNEVVEEVISLKSVNTNKIVQHPCWWNSDAASAKKHLNYCQKEFKRRSTVQNKDQLIAAEIVYENAKVKAEEEWSSSMIEAFENAKTPQEKWTTYHKLTAKQTINSMLPLVTEERPPAFKNKEKCEILQDFFLKVHI